MVILDTDALTIIQRQEGALYDRLAARLDVAAATQPVCVTMISYEEQMRGWLAYIARGRSVQQQVEAYARLHQLFLDFADREVLDFDAQAAARYQGLTRSRVRIGTMDLKIASIALAHDATLISRNVRDYQRVAGLRVEDWTVEPTP